MSEVKYPKELQIQFQINDAVIEVEDLRYQIKKIENEKKAIVINANEKQVSESSPEGEAIVKALHALNAEYNQKELQLAEKEAEILQHRVFMAKAKAESFRIAAERATLSNAKKPSIAIPR
jgi:hypothetical protein